MADDQSLTVQITADESGATAGLSRVSTALDQIIAAMNATKSTGAEVGTVLTGAHDAAAGAAVRHAEAETLLGESLGRVSTATNSAARLFSTLGFETGVVTERVEGLSEAFEGLGRAAVPLLVIGTAILGVAAAFEFLKGGIEEASKAQTEFASIGTAVVAQGGNWKTARAGLEDFLDALEHATMYSRGEALEAINALVTAGTSLADSEKIVAIATDVAAASHRSLIDVVDKIKDAELGRGRGLEQLDEKLKPLIASHEHLSVILNQLAKDMAGQAAAALDTNAGKAQLLSNEFHHLSEELGDNLLPLFNTGLEILINFAEGLEQHEPQIAAFFGAIVGGAERAGNALIAFGKLNLDIAKSVGDVAKVGMNPFAPGAGAAAHDAGNDVGAALKDMATLLNPKSIGDPIGDAMRHANDEFKHERAAAIADLQKYKNALLQNDPVVGNEPKGRSMAPPDQFGQPIGDDSTAASGDTAAYKAENADLKALTASEGEYKEAVKLAWTADEEHAAKLALANKEMVDATASVNIITTALAQEKAALAQATEEQARHQAAADALKNAYNTLLAQVTANGKETRQQKDELTDLRAAYELHNKAATGASAIVSTLTSEIESNSTALATQRDRLNAVAEAEAAVMKAQMEAHTVEAMNTLNEHFAEDQKREQQQRNVEIENALLGLSLTQQLAYYRQQYANEVAAGDQYTAQAQANWSKIISLEGDVYKERLAAQTKFLEDAQKLEGTFLDDILSKHQSLRDSLKDIFKSIEDSFVQMLEQMILKSSLLNGLNAQLAKVFNVGGGVGTGGAGAAIPGLGGLFGGGSAGTGATQAIVPGLDSPGNNAYFDLGSQSVTALTGSPTGVSAADLNNAGGGGDDWSADGFSGADMRNAGGGGANYGNASGASLGSIAGGALQGVAISSLISSLFGGNSTDAAIGGGLGGAVGSIFGPVGGLVGSAAGSILGGLFGSKATPATSPDIFDTQNYGQGVANLTGQMAGANGQYFYSNVMQQTGNQGEIGYIEEALAGATKITSGSQAGWYTTAGGQTLNPQQYQQLVNAFGISATGSGTLNYGHNIGQQWITGAQGASSTPESYSQLDALAASFLSSSGGAAAAIPVFSVGRTYPNMNLGTLNADGTYNESTTGTKTITPSSSSTSTAKTTVGTNSGTSSDAMHDSPIAGNGVVVNIHLDGAKFLTSNDIQSATDQMAQAISKSLARYSNGQLFGGTASRANRTGNW